MGNRLSSTPSGGHPSRQRTCSGDSSSTSNSNIQGHNSGNTNSNNANCGNITMNFNREDTGPSPNHDKILQCLYTSKYESHRARVRKPVEGTCTWVTEHPKYLDWSKKKTSGLLWLSADPGCGKSVAASFLVTHLKSHGNTTVCYFFFKDDNNEQKSATFALCAILHQLFVQRGPLTIFAEAAFRAKGEKFVEEVDTLWDILVTAVAEGGCGDVICVVDALDECGEETLTPLIRHITCLPELQTSNIPLKFLVTSRPYHRIEIELSSRETTIRLRGEDEIKAITTDVTRVIDEGIRNLERVWENHGGLEYLRDLLRSSADRTFLWVSLILELLRNSVDGSRAEMIDIVSTAPASLDELYNKILSKSTDYDKAHRVLNIVVAAARPLTLIEMNIALTIRRDHESMRGLQGDLYPRFEKIVKNWCGLFVRVIDSKIYLVHQTAREFLIKGALPSQGNWQYTLCPKDSNAIMADICISYLSREEFTGSPLKMNAFGEVLEGAVYDYLEKHSFLDYATRHWADHFRDSQGKGMELFKFTRLICGAGSKHCLAWFQVYWFNTRRYYTFPQDFTHLMIASLLGQGTVVDRLLEEEGGDINARSKIYGTALNIAAVKEDEGVTRKLLQKNVKAYLCGKEYNISHMKKSELWDLKLDEEFSKWVSSSKWDWEEESERESIRFLLFCIPDTPDPHTPPGWDMTSSPPSTSLESD